LEIDFGARLALRCAPRHPRRAKSTPLSPVVC
jgi:hypothetical protein